MLKAIFPLYNYVVDINEEGLDVAIKLGVTGCDVLKFSIEESIFDVPHSSHLKC